jgi:hypothetical protein
VSQSQGRPLRLSHADIVRWHEHLLITATCHVWMGAVGSDGYGRFQITNKYDGTRMLTPHQVAARLGFGPIPEGATLLHDCEVRLCCRYGTDHVEVGTQSENMRHAVVRGKVGASRAIQAALRDAVDRSPAGLARVLAGVIADGDPMRDMLPLFDAPDRRAATPALRSPMRAESPSGGVLLRARRPVPASSLPLFEA